MFDSRSRKVNVTGYLSINVIDILDDLAKANNCSRNTLLEEAIDDFLIKKKDQIAELKLI